MNPTPDKPACSEAELTTTLLPLTTRFAAIGLLGLSGRVHDLPAFERGLTRLRSVLPVHGDEQGREGMQRFAADDTTRLAWAQHMATQATPAMPTLLLGIRGGYGISRLLDDLDYPTILDRLHSTSAVICAHSDFTALQLALLSHAMQLQKPVPRMLQGPMLCADFGLEAPVLATARALVQACQPGGVVCVAGLTRLPTDSDHQSRPACIQGLLWGGNLTMLLSLLGTPHWPQIDGGILFFEDVNEHPYRIERMLLQLAQAGVLQRQRAIVVGACSDWKTSPLDNGYDLLSALQTVARRVDVPIVTGLPFGHIPDKCALPVGQIATLTLDTGGTAELHVRAV